MDALTQHLNTRFGPLFDLLNDHGGVPEELLECLKRGAVYQALEQRHLPADEYDRFVYASITFNYQHVPYLFSGTWRDAASRSSKTTEDATPEVIFQEFSALSRRAEKEHRAGKKRPTHA